MNHPHIASVTRCDATGVIDVRLRNGMTALLVPQSDSPVVATQTWYRVGSREEEKGKTGLAHFLEHLLFKGTRELRKGDIDLVTLRNGGQNNADTTYDRTRYWFTFAKDRWERALEVEADRMRGSAFDEHEFQAERGPVLEELRRDHDDPWWRLHETMDSVAYLSHPYHNPVIGWVDEVTRVPREDVLAFYERWYRPGNCTLVAAGGFDADRTIARIADLFGPIGADDGSAGPVPPLAVPTEPPQEGERRFELLLDVQVPKMLAAFHTVAASHPDDVVLDVVQAVLAAGKASRLHERLVRRDALAAEVSAWNDSRRDPGVFGVSMELSEGADPAKAEAALWEEVGRLATELPTHDELERARSLIAAGLVFRRASAHGAADLVGSLEVLAGDWRLIRTVEERVRAVTAEQVRDAAAKYLVRTNRTVGWVHPRPAALGPRPSLEADDVHDLPDPPEETRPEPEILRRAPPRTSAMAPLPVRRVVLPNGLRLLLMRHRAAPTLSVRVRVEAGLMHESAPGLAALAGDCLDEGARGRTGAEISRIVEGRGATLGAGATGVALKCLVRDASALVPVMSDVLRAPTFDPAVVDRVRNELVAALLAEDDDPMQKGRQRFAAEVYGAHPYGRRDKGSVESLRALRAEDLARHHRSLFVPRNTIVSCVGDIPEDEMERLLAAHLGDWSDTAPALRAAPEVRINDAPRDVALREDKDQLHLFLGHLGVRRANPDYHALLVSDMVLGSGAGFTDRLSKKVRDEMGLAYTVSARIARTADLEPGTFMAYVGTAPDQRETALAAIRAEIARYLDGGPTEQETADARSFLLGSYVFGFETADVTADHLLHFERLALGFDEPRAFAEAVSAVTPAAALAAARRHIHPDRFISVAVGKV